MTDVPNDTTQAEPRHGFPPLRSEYLPNRAGDHRFELDTLKWRLRQALADLDRLAGPVCDNPACGGKRAVEHHLRRIGGVALWVYADIPDHSCSRARGAEPRVDRGVCWHCGDRVVNALQESQGHPPAPLIEAWLRERAR